MKEKTLLILAAGMGSRFGGLKQIEPVGPNREFIIDYSIYDAKRTGFTKVVFVIKEENYEVFKETIGKRVEPYIKTEYVFQDYKLVPEKYQEEMQERTKPLGTGHAILCAKDKIKGAFSVINADDFYGYDGYVTTSKYLNTIKEKEYGLVAYHLGNTLPPSGKAKRGVCWEDEDHNLVKLTESKVEKEDNGIMISPLDNSKPFITSNDTLVSLNLFAFTSELFNFLEEEFYKFLKQNEDNLSTCEFLITEVLNDLIKRKEIKMKVLHTTASWYGLTYKEDVDILKTALKEMIEKGEYPQELWKK